MSDLESSLTTQQPSDAIAVRLTDDGLHSDLRHFAQPGANARVCLFDNGDFAYFVNLSPTLSPAGGYCLTISSRWRTAKDGDAEQTRFQACVEREALQALARQIIRQTDLQNGGEA